MESYTRRIFKGLGISLIFSLALNFLNYITNIVLARSLGTVKYGLFSAVLTFILFFLFFRDLGLPQTLARYLAHFLVNKEYNKVKTAMVSAAIFQIAGSVFLCLAIYFSADFLAVHYFKEPSAAFMLQILTSYIFFSAFYILSKNIMLGFQKIGLFSFIDVLKRGLILILSIIFLKVKLGVYAPVLAYAIIGPLLLLFYLPSTIRLFPFFKARIENFPGISKELWAFAIPIFITSIGSKLVGYVDILILTYFRTLSEVGIYNVVLSSALIPLFIGGTMAGLCIPFVSELWTRKDYVRLSEGVRLIYRYVFVLVIPLISTLFVFAQPFFSLFFGEEYAVGITAFRILLVGVLLVTVATINQSIISSMGNPRSVTKIFLAAALVNVIINFLLIPRFGIMGAALSTSLSYALTLLLSVIKIKELLQVKPPVKEWLKLGLLAVGYVASLSLISRLLNLNVLLNVSLSVIIVGLLYGFVVYWLRIINFQQIKYYLSVIRKKD